MLPRHTILQRLANATTHYEPSQAKLVMTFTTGDVSGQVCVSGAVNTEGITTRNSLECR